MRQLSGHIVEFDFCVAGKHATRGLASDMHLMNITLQEGSAITHAVYGNFCGTKSQDIVCSSGSNLRLLQTQAPNVVADAAVSRQLQTVHTQNIYGVVRSLLPFRLTGGTKDYLVVGTDSGKITVLEFIVESSKWEVRHSETFGKTGCRRITPGQYLAADPKGRAIMIGAVEKQKLVYIMNRDASNRLTISSPLEAHRSHTIHFDIVGVDVGFENPIFAALEVDYAELDTGEMPLGDAIKTLVFYELDLGLNHVTRRWSEVVDRSSNKLIAVPGGTDGPGGVLVCSEGWITYKNENHESLPCRIPQRHHQQQQQHDASVQVRSSLLIVAAATHKQRDLFFVIAQTELGDLLKITLTYNTSQQVSAVKCKYFDTIPTTVALCITKTGFLFAASEFGSQYLLQFHSIGDNDDTAECTSLDHIHVQDDPSNPGDSKDNDDDDDMEIETDQDKQQHQSHHHRQAIVPSFAPRRLTNLAIIETLDNLGPVTQLLVRVYPSQDWVAVIPIQYPFYLVDIRLAPIIAGASLGIYIYIYIYTALYIVEYMKMRPRVVKRR
jgi:splicing factor 3B subunit 3